MSHETNRDQKLARDFTGIGTIKRDLIKSQKFRRAHSNGINNSNLIEPVPHYHRAGCEVVNFDITGPDAAKNNCWIILGRDRTGKMRDKFPVDDGAPLSGDLSTGYGGRGDTQSAAIYICAGMASAEPWEEEPPPALYRHPLDGMPTNPDYRSSEPDGKKMERSFNADASFIYLSQKCDIDIDLDLGGESIERSLSPAERECIKKVSDTCKMTNFNTLRADTPRAGIALKSDNVRVVARESIRLQVTSERHAMGQFSMHAHGISLVGAGKAEMTQPLVLGYRLIESMEHLHTALERIQSSVSCFINDQVEFNTALQGHTHVGLAANLSSTIIFPVAAQLLSKNFKTFETSYKHIMDFGSLISSWKSDYTKPSEKYILSQNVFCD